MSVTIDMDALLAKTSALHRHLCPRQVLGVRMGMLAAELFPFNLPQTGKRLLAFVEADGCFSSGVSISTGCSMGRRTMRLADYGKVAATLVDTQTGQAIRFAPAPDSRERAALFAPNARSRWHAQLEAYQQMPNEDLLRWQEVSIALDLPAIIGKFGTRIDCAVCGEEVINQREVFQDGKPLCRSCAGDTYWTPKR